LKVHIQQAKQLLFMKTEIEFDDLGSADLIKGAIYKGGLKNNLSSEPLSKLLKVGNQSGIRFTGTTEKPKMVVLFTSLNDKDWPDLIQDDKVIYYGDNKIPGKEIHDLPGNKILRNIFNEFHLSNSLVYPPILLFTKGEKGFDRIFLGKLKPGYNLMDETEDLIAIWKTKNGERFQNYKAFFTILPEEIIKRDSLPIF
jgi:hypothetical protein